MIISLSNSLKGGISLEDYKKHIGKVLKRLRIENKLTQEELAFRSSIDRTFISKLERGIQEPGLTTIFLLAEALEMKAFELVNEIEESLIKGNRESKANLISR